MNENKIKISNGYDDKLNKARDLIIKEYLNSGKNDIIFICVGTPKATFDSLGPTVGDILEEKSFLFKSFGTILKPIHALNVDKRVYEIQQLNPNSFIIAIDSCVSDRKELLNTILVSTDALQPGLGVGKKLNPVGDMKVVGIVSESDIILRELVTKSNIFYLANIIVKLIETLDIEISKKIAS